MRVAFLFIDGVGVGARDPQVNPLARGEWLLSQFEDGAGTALPSGGQLWRVDTTFGVPGRPQSASNQTAILTARPAPAELGKHVLGYPSAPLRALLAEHSIVRRLTAAGRAATFANAYPAAYLDALGLRRRPASSGHLVLPASARRRLRPSASTLAMSAGGVELRTFDDAHRGLGLTHDLTGDHPRARALGLPRRTAGEAAEIFWRIAEGHALTMFEHYLADEAGHARDFAAAERALGEFDAFAREVIARRPKDAQVLICSDHGNVEDLRTRGHTRNPVAALSFGPCHPSAPGDVAGVGRAIVDLVEREAARAPPATL